MKPAGRCSPAQVEADSLVGRIADEFLQQLQRGEHPDPQEYATRYPQVASVLREILPALEVIGSLGAETTARAQAEGITAESLGVLGDFQILREIGRGGMGVVYEAEQISLNRRVALKVLPFAAAMDERHLQRFRNEAQAAAHLQHQNIVPVYAVGCERGVHYYAMQFVEGRTLAEVIRELRGLGPADRSPPTSRASTQRAAFFGMVVSLGIQAAEALEHAHQLGVVHRDIKPANLLVDARQNLWITDFGLAQVHSDTRLTITGDLLGTLRYMSPEQALANRLIIDHRTDIYSLGATLYELMTLRPVFDGADRQELLRQIAFEEPPPPRQANPTVPPELETIVLKTLSKNPEERFATARELADDLQRFLKDEPIRARRPTLRQRMAKWSRRHPAAVRSSMIILLIAVVTLSVSTVLISRAKRQAEAREAEARAALDFVENKVFAAARPIGRRGGLGHDVTLRQALETALPYVETSFTDQPLVEARLRMTLGWSFWSLGDAKRAAEQAEIARALNTRHLGPSRPDTLSGTRLLASSFRDLGRFVDAVGILEQSLPLHKSALGNAHPDTLHCMHNLARSYIDLGRFEEGLKLMEETLALMKANLGTDHNDTLICMSGLGESYARMGRYAEALKLREETLMRSKASRGLDHPETVADMSSLAISYATHSRHADAMKLFKDVLEIRRKTLGEDHPQTLKSMVNLANSYDTLGQEDEAMTLREQAVALMTVRLGEDHPDTTTAMSGLAHSYDEAGRFAEALELLSRVLKLRQAKLGPDHFMTLDSMVGVGNCYNRLGRHAEALQMRERALAMLREKLGTDHPNTLRSMWAVIESLCMLDRGSEAVPIIDECVRRALGKEVGPNLIPKIMGLRAWHFKNIADPTGCRETAEMWEGLGRTDTESLYKAACFRAVTAAVILHNDKSESAANDANTEANRALQWLRQAVAAGFADARRLEQDPYLSTLRDRQDYRELLARIKPQ